MNEFLKLFSFGYVFRSYSTASADLGHMMLLPRPPEGWAHRLVSPHPASWVSQWTDIKLLFAWLSMVYLEPAGPVPSQSLAWHSGSRGHISSCDLKILKELVLTSQSGYRVSFSINLLFIERMRLLQLLCVMEARERRLPMASASPPSSAFSVCRYPILIPLHYVRSTHANTGHALHLPGAHMQTLGMPSTSQELTFEKWLWVSHRFFFWTGERNSLLSVWPPMQFIFHLSKLWEWRKFLRKSLNFWSELAKIHVWILWLN